MRDDEREAVAGSLVHVTGGFLERDGVAPLVFWEDGGVGSLVRLFLVVR